MNASNLVWRALGAILEWCDETVGISVGTRPLHRPEVRLEVVHHTSASKVYDFARPAESVFWESFKSLIKKLKSKIEFKKMNFRMLAQSLRSQQLLFWDLAFNFKSEITTRGPNQEKLF